MYTPDHFRMPDADLAAFLAQPRAGQLVSVDPATGAPAASFLPWVRVRDEVLTSHLAAVNPQSAHPGPGLVIMMGCDAYVDAAWMGPGAAPTWNYEAVHLHGRLRLHRDTEWIIQSWADLLEGHSDQRIGDWDQDWLTAMARAVTGVEFTIERIDAKSKLSQNRTAAETESVAARIEPACPHLAARMRQVSLPHIAARERRGAEARAGCARDSTETDTD